MSFSGFAIDGLEYYCTDGSYGLTARREGTHYGYNDFVARTGVSTYFHLGSIEFFPVGSFAALSIFNLLRTFNHQSNEMINLTRLLMLLDDNNSQSQLISISGYSRSAVESAGLVLNDLYLDPDEFEHNPKLIQLMSAIGASGLPTALAADEYILEHFLQPLVDGYRQWPGDTTDFDRDGVLNDVDAFPWDGTQTEDKNSDRQGDAPKTENLFLETLGVVQYAVDQSRGFLYVAEYNKKLSRYSLESGELVASFGFEHYITSIDVDKSTGNVYVGLVAEYTNADYMKTTDQNGWVAIVRHDSDSTAERSIAAYPLSLKFHSGNGVFVSALNTGATNGRLLKLGGDLLGEIEVFEFEGSGGQIILGETKLVINESRSYVVFNISPAISYNFTGRFDGPANSPLFILDKYDAIVDHNGTGFTLSPNEDLDNKKTQYLDHRYMGDIFKYDEQGQYIATTRRSLVYINASTLLRHKVVRFNDFSTTLNDATNFHQSKVVAYNKKIYAVTSRRDGTTHVAVIEDRCHDCGASRPPVAAIQSLLEEQSVQSHVVLDASASYDHEDVEGLRFRWDFNGDKKWDTEFVERADYSVKYELSGEKKVVVQVMDSSGLVDESEVVFDVQYGRNFGSLPGSDRLDEEEILIDDVAFDRIRDKIYVTSAQTGEFFVLDGITGNTKRVFRFRDMPGDMDISDDGNVLYLGLRSAGCQYDIVDCENNLIDINDGIVLKFDLESQSFYDSFFIDVSPADIEVEGDSLYVSAATLFNDQKGFKSSISVYDVKNKIKSADLGMGTGNYAEFTNILSVQRDVASGSCSEQRSGTIDESCVGGLRILHETNTWFHKPYHWLLPGTSFAVTRGGSITNTETLEYEGALGSTPVSDYIISDISVDPSNDVIVAGYAGVLQDNGGLIRYFDLNSFTLLAEIPREAKTDWLFAKEGRVVEIQWLGSYRYTVNVIERSFGQH